MQSMVEGVRCRPRPFQVGNAVRFQRELQHWIALRELTRTGFDLREDFRHPVSLPDRSFSRIDEHALRVDREMHGRSDGGRVAIGNTHAHHLTARFHGELREITGEQAPSDPARHGPGVIDPNCVGR